MVRHTVAIGRGCHHHVKNGIWKWQCTGIPHHGFQILTEREEKASVAIVSNLPFSEWGKAVTDPRLVAAMVDRVTFNGHIIETGTESYRLASTRAKRGGKKT
jgi:hypothetical protein